MGEILRIEAGAPAGKCARRAALPAAALALSGILMFSLGGAAGSSATLTPSQEPIPASFFNLNIIFYPGAKVPWPAVPFYGWRLSHANWFELEPQKGQWKFDHLDQLVAMAEQHDSKILMTFEYPPRWASSNPDAPGDWGTGTTGPVRDMDDWETFVRTVATRYRGKIHAYELWNEPDRQKSWLGDTATLVQMSREAYKTLKGVDPSVTVVSPSATYPNGTKWLAEFLQEGGGESVDVIGYHFYTGSVGSMEPPEAAVPIIQSVRKVMAEYHAEDKPLWNTEAGWLGSESYPADEASGYVARAFVLNWAAGISRFYWYGWDPHKDMNIEMVKADNSTMTPAAHAFATIQQWMTGAVMHKCIESENHNWVCEMDRDGAWSYIVWNPGGERAFRVASNWHVSRVTQLSGGTSHIEGGTVQIGIEPVLIQ
ncbi:MAG TPA: cellulase family glycosylhydrolase [Verrucomicrobiae bacterium]|nr:cellulase family glycosylhydrolase [Verrucomicrobiae bacterium]